MRIKEDIPILGSVTVNFLDISNRIYTLYESTDEIKRQKNSPHLGLISHAFRSSSHCRFDYLILQCVISEIIENTFKGTTNAQGSIKVNGKSYLGNDIIKSWILLSNFGHCKNTIGDEKAILLYCLQKKSFQKKLLRYIKDEELRNWSEDVLNNYDYISFHHIIGIYRIYKNLKRRVAFRNEILNVYKLLLLPESQNKGLASPIQIMQLQTIYNIIRDIAVISLDSRNSSLPINLDILGTIFSIDTFERRYQNSKISLLLEPIYSMLCDNLYLNIKSQTHQRSYEVDANKSNVFNFPEVIDKAITEGLYDPTICNLKHFLRIKLHSTNMMFKDISHATRDVLRVKKNLAEVEASMDVNPFTDERVIDFYTTSDFKRKDFPLFISNVSQVIWRQIIGTAATEFDKTKKIVAIINEKLSSLNLNPEDVDQVRNPIRDHINARITKVLVEKNIPSFKDLLWSVINYHINSKYHFDIEHHLSSKYEFFAVKISDYNSFNNLEIAIQNEEDVDRQHELKQIARSAKRSFDGTIIVCLSRIKIYDYSLPPDKRIITDIDGVVLKFNEHELILEFHEGKNTANPVRDGIKDLKSKLVKTLDKNSTKGFKIIGVKNFGAKVYFRHITT